MVNLKTSFFRAAIGAKGDKVEGIIEEDETLFLYSEKGSKKLTRKACKRGMKAKNRDVLKKTGCQY